jgi:hypothetical protein
MYVYILHLSNGGNILRVLHSSVACPYTSAYISGME